MYWDDAYCMCLLCDKMVGTASKKDDEYDKFNFGDECKDFHPIAEHYGDHAFSQSGPMAHRDTMKVQHYEEHWREDELVLVIGFCGKCIKKKFKNFLNKKKFVGNVKKKHG